MLRRPVHRSLGGSASAYLYDGVSLDSSSGDADDVKAINTARERRKEERETGRE